ncbi:carbohydrate sulfotransferase 11-like isoform X2 [Portunus trituberculatus]|uniref:carbohydrate sulfotransferase 11-like isoform X2 n=1 Tax=Portunus trituberculatus TaxID=210409 RepID=UPI001E1CFD10|nr:carbohydrate sulfotransferase 11-like isoform X2 [Portunus trituberculatus]
MRRPTLAPPLSRELVCYSQWENHGIVSGMRCATDKASRVALTVLLVMFMVYLVKHGSEDPASAKTLSLNPVEGKPEMQENTDDLESPTTTGHPDPTPSPTPMAGLRPYTVIKNKVRYLDLTSPLNANANTDEAILKLSEAEALKHLNYSNYNPEERQYLQGRVDVMVERARQVKHACLNPPSYRYRFPNLVWDTKHHVTWCPNYKVASTTWMINFLKLINFNDDNPNIPVNISPERREELKYSPRFGAKHYEVFKNYPTPKTWQEKMDVLQSSARVIIVRHPFTRILSAYRDKMIKPKPLPAKFKFKELQKKIIKEYRPRDSPETSPFPTFPEFVQHIIDSTKYFTTGEDWRKNVKCWVPFWAMCDVCSLDYNVIMKLETMTADERFLITLSDMKELKKTDGEWRHLRNVSSTEAAPDFYRKLNTRQMLDLHQRYKFDFDLFGYNLDSYLPLATDAHLHARRQF